MGEFTQRVVVLAPLVSFLVCGFRQFFQPIARKVFHVRHFCGDEDLDFYTRTRTVFLVTSFFVPDNVGCPDCLVNQMSS